MINMSIWKKKKDYLDLSENMRKKQAQIESFNSQSSKGETNTNSFAPSSSKEGFFTGFFGGGDSNALTPKA